MSVEVTTFGCRLNGAESDAMRRLAEQAGHHDLHIVNTCAVTADAARQARRTVRRLGREGASVAVTGCAAQIAPGEFADLPGVAAVIGNAEKGDAATWAGLAGLLRRDGTPLVRVGDIMAARHAPAFVDAPPLHAARAFLPVQTGCDHRCTFCAIPFGRGSSRSLPLPDAVAAARALAARGVGEIVLTGVDLTSYGVDGGPDVRLGHLVRAILRALPDLGRLRLSSVDSIEADAELLRALAEEPRLMPHLHLSLQAGDDLVLKRMKRRHSRADAIRFCAEVRGLRPDIVFGADLIAGFPTETDAMAASTLDLVEECGLTWLHVFPYSPRVGTPAARMPAVAAGTVAKRAARLREAGGRAVARHLETQLGQGLRVLVEGPTLGRTEGFAPVRLPSGRPVGSLAHVEITGHDGRQLIAA